MDSTIARSLLNAELEGLRVNPYSFFAQSVNKTTHKEILGPDGFSYQIELEVFWDNCKAGNIRVQGSVDDGKWRALKPLTESFIIAPDGTFLDE
jgi:hypothetical protein